MKGNFLQKLVLTIIGMLLLWGCGNNNHYETSSGKAGETQRIKVSGSKEDLCRIVMSQKRLVKDTGSDEDIAMHNYITTVLSDGKGERVVVDIDSIAEEINQMKEISYLYNAKEESLHVKEWNGFLLAHVRGMDSLTIVSLSPAKKGKIFDLILQKNYKNKQTELKKQLGPLVYENIMKDFDKHLKQQENLTFTDIVNESGAEEYDNSFSADLFKIHKPERFVSIISAIPAITKDLKSLVYKISYGEEHYRGLHHRISENLATVDLVNGQIDFILKEADEDSELRHGRKELVRRQEINAWGLCLNSATIFCKSNTSLWLINAASGKKTRYTEKEDFPLFNFFPISLSEFLVNYHIPSDKPNSKAHLGKFAMGTGKISPFPSMFDFQSFSISENAATLFFFNSDNKQAQEDAASTLQNESLPSSTEDKVWTDTVFVYTGNFQKQKQFMVSLKNDETFFGKPDPEGKWIYYCNDTVVYRIKASFFRNGTTVTLGEIVGNSEIVYAAPVKKNVLFEINSFFITKVSG